MTTKATIKRGGGDKNMPYTFADAQAVLVKPLDTISTELKAIRSSAKPRGEGVFELVLHPTFLARSYYPTKLFTATGLRDVGSKEKVILPRKVSEARLEGKNHATASIYVAGNESNISKLKQLLISDSTPVALKQQLSEVESIKWIEASEKLRGNIPKAEDASAFEVALHAGAHEEDIVVAFQRFCKELGATVDLQRRIRVGGLTFLPVTATPTQIRGLSAFTFLRVARVMPEIRVAVPNMVRQSLSKVPFTMPSVGPVHPTERIAIFDGGLGTADLSQWATEYSYPETSQTAGQYLIHGTEVTSTFLFGRPSNGMGRPYMGVDHYRVLAPLSGKDPDLFDVLLRIKGVLDSGKYKFANFSLGPRMPICDDEVHTWTATLDQLCATHDILATVAVGNDGTSTGADRIQPPGDMVNALAIGACNSPGAKWKRAPYSCIGPGRSPGFVKPDGLAFGGSDAEPFDVFNPILNSVVGVQGTSYAAPLAMRSAAGIAATTTFDLSSISIKALMIHYAETLARQKRHEVGWGRFKENITDILDCGPGSATIIFKDFLAKGEYRRCPVPFPDAVIDGKVIIKATFCINSHTDPEHAINYTRSGMGITFRPLHGIGDNSTSDFFGIKSQYKNTEREMRDAGHKWETVLHREHEFQDASSLASPVFDIDYQARSTSRGVAPASAPDVSFALVVSIVAPNVPNIYDLIRQRYPVLQPVTLRNVIDIQT